MNKDFIDILREIRGNSKPGQAAKEGIWYELTQADKNGNAGIYGDILAKYGIVTDSAGTFDQAVAILENLNVEVTTLPAGSAATSALVNGVWQIGIPRGTNGTNGTNGINGKNGKDGVNGKDGIDGKNGQAGSNGLTPQITLSYNDVTGNLECLIEYSNDIDSRLKEW